jgi:hypothetical protein
MYGNNPFWKFKQYVNEYFTYKTPSGSIGRLGSLPTSPPDDDSEKEAEFREGRQKDYTEGLRATARKSHEAVSKLENHGINLDQSSRAIGITSKDEADEYDINTVGTATHTTHPTVRQHLDNINKLHLAVVGSFPKHIYDVDPD